MNRHAAFVRELTAAIPGAPEPYSILLARAAIAISKEQQWHADAIRERDAMRVKLETWRNRSSDVGAKECQFDASGDASNDIKGETL